MLHIQYKDAHTVGGTVGDFIKSFAVRQGSPILSKYIDGIESVIIKDEDIDNLYKMGYFNYKYSNNVLSFYDHKLDSPLQKAVSIYCELNPEYQTTELKLNTIQDKTRHFFIHQSEFTNFCKFLDKFNSNIVKKLLSGDIVLCKAKFCNKYEKSDIIQIYNQLSKIKSYITKCWINILFITNLSRLAAHVNGLI